MSAKTVFLPQKGRARHGVRACEDCGKEMTRAVHGAKLTSKQQEVTYVCDCGNSQTYVEDV